MSNQKIAKLEAAIEFLSERVADLQNPMLYNVGDKVRAEGKNSLNHVSYEGDIIDSHFVYKKYDTTVSDFSATERINCYKIYNTRSKTVHEVSDLQFDIYFKTIIK